MDGWVFAREQVPPRELFVFNLRAGHDLSSVSFGDAVPHFDAAGARVGRPPAGRPSPAVVTRGCGPWPGGWGRTGACGTTPVWRWTACCGHAGTCGPGKQRGALRTPTREGGGKGGMGQSDWRTGDGFRRKAQESFC